MELTNLNKDRKQRRKGSPLELSTMMYGKVPPQAKDLEDAILGAIMLDKEAMDVVSSILKPQTFYVEANQRIYGAMISLREKNFPIDMLTVVEELKSREELDLVGGPYYVSKLTNTVVSGAHIEAHSRIIVQKFILRELIRVAGEILGDAYEDSTDAFDLLDEAGSKMLNVGSDNVKNDMAHISSVVVEALEKIEYWAGLDSTVTGVPSGFPDLDFITRGWQPGELIILAARPSVGKSALATNFARAASDSVMDGLPSSTALWSLEMKAVYLVLRILSAESEIWMTKIQKGQLSPEDMKLIWHVASQVLSKKEIYFDQSSHITLTTLSAKARRLAKQCLKRGKPLRLIIVDYLQLMSNEERKGSREQDVAAISRGLKNLAQELDIPVIALSQLSREAEAKLSWSKGPGLKDLRESGAIEQDADTVLMLWGPNDDDLVKDPSLINKRKIGIVKARNGGLSTVIVEFRNEIQLFKAIGQDDHPGIPSPGPKLAEPYRDPTISNAEAMEDASARLYYQKGSRMNDDEDRDDDLPF